MRAIARVFVIASLTASGALPVLAASTGPAPERGARFDAQGRLVYSPSVGRVLYDDEDEAPAAAPAVASGAEVQGVPAAAPTAAAPLALGAAATGSSLVVKREWHRVAFGQSIGSAGLRIADVDADGQPEIVSGAWPSGYYGNRAFYIVSRQGDEYAHEWSSLPYADEIASVRVAQADADSALEVLVGVGSRIEIWDGASRTLERTVTTAAAAIRGLAVADVDDDGAQELVFCDEQKLFIHDLATGVQEFLGAGLGGAGLDVGQADADAALEIAVGSDGSAGLLVDGKTRAIEWSLAAGFGQYVRLGDLDGDGRAELVAGFRWYRLAVYDTATQSVRYEVPMFNLAAVRLADVEGDGPLELVYGDAQWGEVHVLEGATGVEKWRVNNPEHGITDIAVGDVDGDGGAEIVFGAGQSSTGADHLYVADSVSHAIEWESLDENGPYYGIAFGDVDADAAPELVHTSFQSDSGYDDGIYFVHDAVSKALEHRSGPVDTYNFNGVWRVRAANVDADPQLELLITSGNGYTGSVYCFDGLTHAEQWRTSIPNGLSVRSLQLDDLEGDSSLELVASVGQEHTGAPGHFAYVFDAATGALEWQSPALGTGWPESSLLRVAQVDDDPAREIVVASHGGALWVVDGSTRAIERSFASLQVTALETADRDGDGRAEVIIGTSAGKIQLVDLVTSSVQDIGSFGGLINGLALVDVTGDGTLDLLFCVADRLRIVDGATGHTPFVSDVLGSGVGAHDSLLAADVDGDGAIEVVVNLGPYGLMVFEASLEADTTAPTVTLTSPPAGPVAGTVVLQAQASDDRGVSEVGFYLDGALLGVDASAPYSFSWDTTTAANGSHALHATAVDAASNVGTSPNVEVTVANAAPGNAVYDPTLRAPRCPTGESSCDSGTLLVGRGPLGPEPSQPNTIGGSCADGTGGAFHGDESNDRLQVVTLDGTPLAVGKNVRVLATVWAWSGYTADKLDLYYASNALAPTWHFIATITPPAAGAQVLSASYTLPSGGLQVLRARFRYGGNASPCGPGSYNDHDDLVFGVVGGDTSAPEVSVTAPAQGATVAGTVGVEATAGDDTGVTRVEFLVDGQVKFNDTVAPWYFPWDTTLFANEAHTLAARAHDAAGNVGQSTTVTVSVQNGGPGTAVYDAVLRVPACAAVGSVCDSGTLLVGRGNLGPEPNQPNTIAGSCGDASGGTFHNDESNDRLSVRTLDGTPFAPGKTVLVEATVWGWSGGGDYLDLYYSASATSPAWVPIGSQATSKVGAHTLSATYTVPVSIQPGGGLQAVRARFRYQGAASPCSVEAYTDHDDLVFAVQQ
jgi:hypothetical protein